MNNYKMTGMTRRQFAATIGAASAFGLIESPVAGFALADSQRSLTYLANRSAGAEGTWELKKIEGRLPQELNGLLIRTAPGQKEIFGTKLRHLFDGDAYLSKFTFRAGRVSLTSKFLDTPQRLEELQLRRMIYTEAGTLAPAPPEGYQPKHRGKNQPSVNIIRWDGRLLGLSEGGHPTAIDPHTLSYQGEWNFYGTLPADMSFTAHPKFDPQTGEGYTYGIKRGMGMALTVYRMEKDGKLKQLHALPQKNYFMIHDMLLAREHLIFVIPPVHFDLPKLFSGKVAPFETVRYIETQPLRLVILRKDGAGKPVTIEQPAGMVFHHGNAFEKDGQLIIDSLLSPDGSVMQAVASWDDDKAPNPTPNHLTRLILDPARGAVVSRTEFEAEQEFPRFDERRGGSEARYLYTAGFAGLREPAFNALARHDLQRGVCKRVPAGQARTFAEPVFVPHPGKDSEERGWLLALGYDGRRDETFLEIRDAGTMDFQARVWTGIHFPLGFHGNFYAG